MPSSMTAVRPAGNDEYEVIPASQTLQALGSVGSVGDYLSHLLLVVSTVASSQVSLKDGSETAFVIFPNNPGGGVGTYAIPIGMTSRDGQWQVTTGAGVVAIAVGDFHV